MSSTGTFVDFVDSFAASDPPEWSEGALSLLCAAWDVFSKGLRAPGRKVISKTFVGVSHSVAVEICSLARLVKSSGDTPSREELAEAGKFSNNLIRKVDNTCVRAWLGINHWPVFWTERPPKPGCPARGSAAL